MEMNDKILKEYIEGGLEERERKAVLEWINSSDENFERFARLKSDLAFDDMPDKVMSEAEFEQRLLSNDLFSEKSGNAKKISFIKILTRAAAILLLPVLVAGTYLFISQSRQITEYKHLVSQAGIIPNQIGSEIEYKVTTGVKGVAVLPDSSVVWLNSATTLRCPSSFGLDSREVFLSGEAFFEVKGNPEWPMYIRTNKGITAKVTGTSFNISSYDNDDEMVFTLVTGKVTLIEDKTKREVEAVPNEKVIMRDNKSRLADNKVSGVKKAADVYVETAWKEGVLLFDDTQMTEVIKKLERWYGVTINVTDDTILNYHITASFKSESITQVLELFKISSNIGYEISDNSVSIFRK